MNAITQVRAGRPAGIASLMVSNPVTMMGTLIVMSAILLAVLAPWVAPYGPYDADATRIGQHPSRAHPFGTDQYGYDIFSRVIFGARFDLVIAVGAVLTALSIGIVIGAVAGYWGSWVDEITMRIMDMAQAFPGFILAMGIAAALGPELHNVIIAIGVTNIPIYARLMRSKVISVKQSDYIMAAKCLGTPTPRLLLLHLLPNCFGPVFVQSTLQCGWAILSAAGLSFIGLGVRIPDPEWGVMISMGVQRILQGHWWISFFPGLAIIFTAMGFNLIGDGLQDVLDPRRKR